MQFVTTNATGCLLNGEFINARTPGYLTLSRSYRHSRWHIYTPFRPHLVYFFFSFSSSSYPS